MNVYDAAHQLARALSECTEYKEFNKIQEDLKKDPQAEKMLKDLREKQFELYSLKAAGKPTEEAEKNLENLYCFLQEEIPHFCKEFSPGTGGEFLC